MMDDAGKRSASPGAAAAPDMLIGGGGSSPHGGVACKFQRWDVLASTPSGFPGKTTSLSRLFALDSQRPGQGARGTGPVGPTEET